MKRSIATLLILFVYLQCSSNKTSPHPAGDSTITSKPPVAATLQTGADQLDLLVPKIKDKRVALVVNYTAVIGKTHLADTLKTYGVTIKKIMSPEHGFRGTATA